MIHVNWCLALWNIWEITKLGQKWNTVILFTISSPPLKVWQIINIRLMEDSFYWPLIIITLRSICTKPNQVFVLVMFLFFVETFLVLDEMHIWFVLGSEFSTRFGQLQWWSVTEGFCSFWETLFLYSDSKLHWQYSGWRSGLENKLWCTQCWFVVQSMLICGVIDVDLWCNRCWFVV